MYLGQNFSEGCSKDLSLIDLANNKMLPHQWLLYGYLLNLTPPDTGSIRVIKKSTMGVTMYYYNTTQLHLESYFATYCELEELIILPGLVASLRS